MLQSNRNPNETESGYIYVDNDICINVGANDSQLIHKGKVIHVFPSTIIAANKKAIWHVVDNTLYCNKKPTHIHKAPRHIFANGRFCYAIVENSVYHVYKNGYNLIARNVRGNPTLHSFNDDQFVLNMDSKLSLIFDKGKLIFRSEDEDLIYFAGTQDYVYNYSVTNGDIYRELRSGTHLKSEENLRIMLPLGITDIILYQGDIYYVHAGQVYKHNYTQKGDIVLYS